ncbi:hypothetical protein SAMN04488494_0619 [Xylanibacter ruminicola]|uniref:Uncharacterized protein n=1 Tax=Xylanibacter ruminicola TaxID=839 RepID=A0A1M7D410_XYLRU|nr:hypothetical protein [Xylanibacter ruminicola]SHL74133.1 hypothetical protein SAMN04488494_0619 [Xylanibacter ruminicola]
MYKVTSSSVNTTFECKQEAIIVQGNVTKDELTGEIQYINGSCYRPNEQNEIGEHFGNFNGYMRDGELKYSISEMNRKDSNLAWGAIDEIEAEVLPKKKN